jgi:C4-dicarboxylate-specific signal transduction histidine kinase
MDSFAGLKTHLAFLVRLSDKQWTAIFRMILLLVAVIGVKVTEYEVDIIRQGIIKDSQAAMQSVSVHLTAELNELEIADDILAGLPWVTAVLESGKAQEVDQANENLQHFNRERGTSVCYILNRDGTAVASSNYLAEDRFVGKNYSIRKYFTQAIRGIEAKEFALGMTSSKKGLYTGSPVRDNNNRVIGVAVVKKDLDPMESLLKKYPPCFFINHMGIVLLSSNPEFSMKSLWPLDKKIAMDEMSPGKSGTGAVIPLFAHEIKNGTEAEFQGVDYLVSREYVGQDGWSIVFLASLKSLTFYRIGGLVITAIMLCLLILTNLAVHSWRNMHKRSAQLHNKEGLHDQETIK